MHILIAEDDDYKRDQLADEVRAHLPAAELVFARSFRSAVDAILAEHLDLVLLDMTMPTFDPSGPVDMGRYEPFAGMEVLSEIDRAGLDLPVVVVTQFERFGAGEGALTLPELHQRLSSEYGEVYRGFVFFDSGSAEWRSALADAIRDTIRGTA